MSLFLIPDNSNQNVVFVPHELWEGNNKQSRKATAVQGGVKVQLNAGEAGELLMGKTYASVRQITDSCFAIRNTIFNPVTPKPEWYDGLNSKFNTVKKYADQWIDDYSIVVTSTIPESVMTYSPVFFARANYLQQILSRGSGDLSETELTQIRDVLTKMRDKSIPIYNRVKQYAREEDGKSVGKLVDWESNMSGAQLELKSGSDSIQKASGSLQKEISDFKNEIKTLKSDIEYYHKLVATGAGLVGVGTYIGIIGGGLCFAFPVIGGIILAIGIASVIGGSVVWGVYQKKINNANSRIVDLSRKITENGKTVAALTTLSTSVDLAVGNAQKATNNLINFGVDWHGFGNSLDNLIHSIDEGRASSDRFDMMIELDQSIKYWKQVENYAQRLLDVPAGIEKHKASDVA